MGLAQSMYDANWPPKATWSVEDIPDLSGKVILVTGGNSGIGKETCLALLSKKAKVYIAAHSQSRVEAAIQELKAATGNEAIFIALDLANLSSVKAAATAFQLMEPKLDVLINNAGVMNPPNERLTKDGYDQQWGVNVVGPWYFTKLLIPQLSAAGHSRVLHISSHANLLVKSFNWNILRDSAERRKTAPLDLYNQSKYANVTVSSEFARRYGDRGIVSMAIHPGLIITPLGRDMSQFVVKAIHLFLAYDATHGALTSLWGATSPETANANGKYLIPWGRIGKPNPGALDPEFGEKLWAWLDDETKNVV